MSIFIGSLKLVPRYVERAMEDPEDVDIAVILEKVRNPIMAV
jgi:hypothetical protein